MAVKRSLILVFVAVLAVSAFGQAVKVVSGDKASFALGGDGTVTAWTNDDDEGLILLPGVAGLLDIYPSDGLLMGIDGEGNTWIVAVLDDPTNFLFPEDPRPSSKIEGIYIEEENAVLGDPRVQTMTKKGSPFRIVCKGYGFQAGITLRIDSDNWPQIKRVSDTKLIIQGGKSLKAKVPKGQQCTFEFTNPDGGGVICLWQW